jgi:GTP cyclohydrolase II
MIERFSETQLPTEHGQFRCVVYREGGIEHVAMVVGDVSGHDVLCRVHSECLTSEVLGSVKCDCKAQLDGALRRIQEEGRGVVVYLRQEGRGIGLGNKIAAYALQEQGHDTVDANRLLGLPDDTRDYAVAARILEDLGVEGVDLMTNNPLKVKGLEEGGIVVDRVEHLVEAPSHHAASYLATKSERMGHMYEADVPLMMAAGE